MNYLAHFHLARHNDDWIAGALLGDFVKGPVPAALPPQLRAGIQLHRRIDACSDAHPLRIRFAEKLPSDYRRYAGIVLDVCCDHWLTQHWSSFEGQSLANFSRHVYRVLSANFAVMPVAAARMAERLIEHDVLTRCGDGEVVAATLERIGARLRRDNPLRRARADLPPYLDAAEPIFLELYPHLLAVTAALPAPPVSAE